MMIVVLCLGVIMAGIVFFGHDRQGQTAKAAGRVEQGQSAYEALALAAKRVQSMYANEAGCNPESLDTRLSNLPNLPASPTSSTYLSNNNVALTYIIANPAASSPDKENRCTGASGIGCRQMAIPIDTAVFIVTAGLVGRDGSNSRGSGFDCPRDATVFLSTVANSTVYVQRVSLTNICTLQSCAGSGFDTTGNITLSNTTNATTSACTGSYVGITARHYGAGFTEAGTTTLSLDDLRWARRYLETGGENGGETAYLYYTGSLPTDSSTGRISNGACPVSGTDTSGGQCIDKACFPFFDLNRDGKNNEEDLAILENFMRGYLTTLPVNDGLL
jgi:hypothetical protein